MKEKAKEIWRCAFGTFVVSNILMIWLQGGGRYSNNSNVSLKACLIVSIPITCVVTILLIWEGIKKCETKTK